MRYCVLVYLSAKNDHEIFTVVQCSIGSVFGLCRTR